jgi:cysteine/O-acetylserine efflux protein
MITSTILAYLPYALITTFTPGPNNLISFYSVSSHGWKQGIKVISGIGTAILIIMLLAALFCHELTTVIESSAGIFKWFGALYILWLAIQIAKDKPDGATFNVTTFSKGFLLVFLNFKMILYAVTIFGGYIVLNETSLLTLLFHVVFLTALCTISNLTWAAVGSFLQNLIYKHYRPFNILMALILVYCSINMILT